MSVKIPVKSGDPYRAPGGKFGTSPEQKLKDSFAALRGKSFVSRDDNKKKVDSFSKEATAKLAALRGTNGGSFDSYSSMTPEEFSKAIVKDYGKQASWTDAQKEAVLHYADVGYRDVNKYLVTGSNEGIYDSRGLKDSKVLDKQVSALDSAMKNKLKKDTSLYRGYVAADSPQVGAIINYKGFNSTSWFSNKAIEFATAGSFAHEGKQSIVLKIMVKKGQRGIIPKLVNYSGIRASEGEFILPRNMSFKVNKITDRGIYKQVEVSIV